jgi:ribosomal silencing factor RsfS
MLRSLPRSLACRRLLLNPISGNGQVDTTCFHFRFLSSSSSSSSSGIPPSQSSSSSSSTEWIPPNRPLSGDKGQSHLYLQEKEEKEEIRILEEELEQEQTLESLLEDVDDEEEELRRFELALQEEDARFQRFQEQVAVKEQSPLSFEEDKDDLARPVDWLQTRRKVLGNASAQTGVDIPIIRHQLLAKDELVRLLKFLGGYDIQLILDNPKAPRMGGIQGMIFCSASNAFHISSCANAVVEQLKLRKLQEVGVIGAQFGSEGSIEDAETWRVVDCQNFVVHILDDMTRDALQLEALWSGKDPIWHINWTDEEAVDGYVAKHPVPDAYERATTLTDMDQDIIAKLSKTRYATPYRRPIVPKSRRGKNTRPVARR